MGEEKTAEELELEADSLAAAELAEGAGEGEDEEVPAFMLDEDEDEGDEDGKEKPTEPHPGGIIRQKKKLKVEREKVDTLEEENRQLKERLVQNEKLKQADSPPKMPRSSEFDTTEEYEDALEKYQTVDYPEFIRSTGTVKQTAQQQNEQRFKRINEGAEEFFSNAETLVTKHKALTPEIYKDALDSVQDIVETAFPMLGDGAFPEFLSNLSKGDEATLFQIGKNKGRKAELTRLLAQDPRGIKAFTYIANLTGQNVGKTQKQTKAPKPPAVATGEALPVKDGKLKKAYDAAHATGDGQKAFEIKQKAKAANVSVKGW